MASTIIIPNEAMLSVPIPPAYIGRQVEVTFALVDETKKPKQEVKLSDTFRNGTAKENDYDFFYSVSEKVLAKDWLNEYEDEAWKNL
jgi:hypothetical protein